MRAFAKFFKSDALIKSDRRKIIFSYNQLNLIQVEPPKTFFQRCHRDFPAQSHARLARVDGNTEFRIARCRRAKQAKSRGLPVYFGDEYRGLGPITVFIKPAIVS
jgi:hypothetical protein